jgi:SH3 domain-containing YSC84-like protein 1
MKLPAALAVCCLFSAGLANRAAADKKDQEERLDRAADAVKEILALPEGIPTDILDKAECVCVFPSVKKFALGVGGSYGKGAMFCRTGVEFDGPWGAPAMMRLEGGSIGFQIGGSATDFFLLLMNPKGVKSVLSSRVKLGADASVAAGPLGRTATAETDALLNAEILSYSRAKGLFAGVSLEGSTLREDHGDNRDLYGREIGAQEIVRDGKVEVPDGARRLVTLLQKASPQNRSK